MLWLHQGTTALAGTESSGAYCFSKSHQVSVTLDIPEPTGETPCSSHNDPSFGAQKTQSQYHRNTWTLGFITDLLKQLSYTIKLRCPTAEEWARKMWYISTTDCYSALKKGLEITNFTSKWVELEKFILTEIISTTKDKHHVFSLTRSSWL